MHHPFTAYNIVLTQVHPKIFFLVEVLFTSSIHLDLRFVLSLHVNAVTVRGVLTQSSFCRCHRGTCLKLGGKVVATKKRGEGSLGCAVSLSE